MEEGAPSGLVHEDTVSTPTGLVHEDSLGVPSQAAPALVHEDQVTSPGLPKLHIDFNNWGGTGRSLDQLSKESVGAMGMTSFAGPMATMLMRPLSYGIRGMTNATMQAAELTGVPGAKQFNQQFNPEGRWFPQTYPSDVSDFYLDRNLKPDEGAGLLKQMAYSAGKGGLGIAANWYLDPMRRFQFGEFTEAAKDLQKVGDVDKLAAGERNLVSVTAPLSGKQIASVPMTKAEPYIEQIKSIPGVGALSSLIQAFSPDTGHPVVDRATNLHAMQGYGEANAIRGQYLAPEAAKNFSQNEKNLIFALNESTPNLVPTVPEPIIREANKGRAMFVPEPMVRDQLRDALPDLAKEHGVELVPGRAETLIDSAINAKKSDSRYVESMVRSGNIDESNVNTKLIENHMPHEIDPAYRDTEMGKQVLSKYVSSRDITRQRKMQGGVLEVNGAIADAGGPPDFFITDPHVATAIRELRALKLERDTRLMETIAPLGARMNPSEAKKAGLQSIPHEELKGKTVVISRQEGANESVQTAKIQDLVFPPNIASKMTYYLNPKAVTNLTGSLGEMGKYLGAAISGAKSLNQINRATAFMSEGMFGRNTVDNFVKGAANGLDPAGIFHTHELIRGRGEPVVGAPNALDKNGRTYSPDEFRALSARFGMNSANVFQDGAGDFLGQAKKLTLSQVARYPGQLGLKWAAQAASDLMHKVVMFGEYGENLTRSAFFRQKLQEGYQPAEAALQTNKFLFDYRRNSPVTDFARFFMPFVQHPIKTALVAPELVGKAPGLYNFVSNSLPHVMAAAFHDPVSQEEINQILPDSLKLRDVVAGPIIPANTWLGHILVNPKAAGSLGAMAYFDPGVGMRILNHFDYTTQLAREGKQIQEYGLSPLSASVLHIVQSTDNFGKPLKGSAVSEFFWKGIMGNVVLPNTWKWAKQQMGVGDPQAYETDTVLAQRGSFGQFGGFTNLDRDAHSKIQTLTYAASQIVKQGLSDLKPIGRDIGSGQPSYSQYLQSARSVPPISNKELYAELQIKKQEQASEKSAGAQKAQAAVSALSGRSTPEDFVARMKSIDQTLKQVNQAYQFGVQRYLQMSAGAKSPAEAREAAGVKLYRPAQTGR